MVVLKIAPADPFCCVPSKAKYIGVGLYFCCCPGGSFFSSIPNCELLEPDLLYAARKSPMTSEVMLLAIVCWILVCWVVNPTGTKPKTAIKQKPATPSARTTSTSENPEAGFRKRFIAGILPRCRRCPLTESRRHWQE